MIPEARQPGVARALREAFGANDFEDVRPLTGGLSPSLVLRIVVRGTPYLLRLIPQKNALGDPAREFAYMTIAAAAGIAPRIWHASVEDRVLITDFIEARPLPDDLALRMAPVLRTLHSLQGFPKSFDWFAAVDGFVQRFQAAQILPESATEELFRRYAAIAQAYPRNNGDRVATHNDLRPENIMFDGDRIWLVDWEAGALNDPYMDLAHISNFFVRDDAHAETYLAEYFGEPAGEYRRARFYLMQQILHVSYVTFLLLFNRSDTPVDPEMTRTDFREFHRRLLAGEASLATKEGKLEYAMVHLDRALHNMRTPRFDEAVARVRAEHIQS